MFEKGYLFFRFYSNLPLDRRDDIIMDLPGFGKISWNVAYQQIHKKTRPGETILRAIIIHNLMLK